MIPGTFDTRASRALSQELTDGRSHEDSSAATTDISRVNQAGDDERRRGDRLPDRQRKNVAAASFGRSADEPASNVSDRARPLSGSDSWSCHARCDGHRDDCLAGRDAELPPAVGLVVGLRFARWPHRPTSLGNVDEAQTDHGPAAPGRTSRAGKKRPALTWRGGLVISTLALLGSGYQRDGFMISPTVSGS